MRHIYPPNPLSILPEQTTELLNKLSDYNEYDVCLASPLFEDYKYGRVCILSWKQMQDVSDHKHLFEKTIQKFER